MLKIKSFTNLFENLNNDLVKCGKLPEHVAYVMDGNRRYSKINDIPRREAYRRGALNLVNVIALSYEFSIKEISFYTFSLDNFGRCEKEQKEVFQSLKEVLEEEVINKAPSYRELGIYVRFVGKTKLLPDYIQQIGHKLEELTRLPTEDDIKLMVNINIAYSGMQNICQAGNAIIKKLIQREITSINFERFENCLYLKESRPVDLMVRTSGEVRKSDFLLWESSDSKFFTLDKLWPEFDKLDLFEAILYYQREA